MSALKVGPANSCEVIPTYRGHYSLSAYETKARSSSNATNLMPCFDRVDSVFQDVHIEAYVVPTRSS